MARAADFDLAVELARPSFTPGARDAAALVQLIVDGAEPAAARAAAAIAKLGPAGRAAIEARDSVDEAAQARLIGALGLFARAGDEAAATSVIAALQSPRVRVRRAAAVALGKLGGDAARAALIARWDAGAAPPDEQRALAEALGKVGGEDALERLRSLAANDDRELMRRRDRAVLMADRSARRDEASIVAGDVAPPSPIEVQLLCRPGLGALLCEELAALQPRPIADRGAAVRWTAPLAGLFASRLWAQLAIPLALPGGDLASAIVKTMTAPATRALLRGWTRGAIRWRLGFAAGHKRAVVWRVARDVTAAAPELINDPTATTWDVVVDDEARTLALMPRRLDDPRFAYRVADVPAASHPSVAAALAFVAAPAAGERIWDPFCGSGLELIECAQRAAGTLIGSDVDDEALAAARANLGAAQRTAQLASGDARTHAPGSVDAIVTNPPLGSRVQLDAAALLVAALPHFARTLATRGRLVWITPAAKKTTPVAEALGLTRTRALPVDLGGVRGHFERWERR